MESENRKEREKIIIWDRFSKNHCFVVNSLGALNALGLVSSAKVCRADMVNIIPRVVNSKAKFFVRGSTVIFGFGNAKLDISHPDIIVPKASRFRDFVSLRFSSPAGTSGESVE